MTDADANFLADVVCIIEEKHRVLLSLEELEIAIDLQTKRLDGLKRLKDKQAVYAMVMLDCFKFLKAGKVDDPEDFDESTTEGICLIDN
jgi:hypothetical protein